MTPPALTSTPSAAPPSGRVAPPASLFKYFGPQGTRLFDNWHLRCSQPGALNDPFEFRPHVAGWGTHEELKAVADARWEAYAKEQYDDLSSRLGPRMSFAEFRKKIEYDKAPMMKEALARDMAHANQEMAEKMAAQINEGIGVLCLCEDPDDLLMWAHYANEHKGFVVEFDTAADFFNTKTPPAHAKLSAEDIDSYPVEYGYLRKVAYVPTRPTVLLTNLKFDTFAMKGELWQYEKEWRMLMPLDCAAPGIDTIVDGHRLCLWPVAPATIKRVIVGARAGPQLIERVHTLKTVKASEHIALERCRIDGEHFRVNFEPLGH